MNSMDDASEAPHFPGSASLLNDLGKKVVVTLRGQKCYVGYLRAVDQFGNIILHETIEQVFVGNKYAEINLGILLVRGENISLIGEQKSDFDLSDHFELTSKEEITKLQDELISERKKAHKLRAAILSARGIGWHEHDTCLDYL